MTPDVSDKLSELGVEAGMYVAPMLNVGTEMEQEARSNGYALTNENGEPYEIPLGYRTDAGERGESEYSLAVLTRDDDWRDRHNRLFYTPCLMPDFTNPAAVRWWKDKIKAHIQAGAFAIAMSDFGEDVPVDACFHNGRSGLEMHNIYTLLYQKATFEAVEEGSDHRGLVNARSGTAGMQRYPICWSGDPNCTWEDMLADLRAGLSIGLSGVPFWSCDNGGFSAYTGDLTPELWMRWSQWSMFQSHMRLHGDAPPRVPWLLGEPSTANFRKYAKLRYRLLPYIYSHAYHATMTALPLMRAMVLEYTDDPITHDLDDQYMFGDAFLVAPVYSPTNRRTVYLPAGKWYDYWNGSAYSGPAVLHIEPDLDELPLYVRSDSIIPMGPDMAFVGERPFDPITLDIWLDDEAESTIFDDSGDEAEIVTCRAQRQTQQTILEVSASKKRYIAKFNQASLPSSVKFDSVLLAQVDTYQDFEQTESTWFFDTASTLYVKFTGSGESKLLTLQN
jgi:alpha-D-xyloside xylohydrolase